MLRKLFEPTRIGSMELKNRVVYTPTVINFGAPDGDVTPDLIEYYCERAKSGMGLLTVEAAQILDQTIITAGRIAISQFTMIPGLNKLVEAIREATWPDPPKIIIQLSHVGREMEPEFYPSKDEGQIVAPSSVPSVLHPIFPKAYRNHKHGTIPRELTIEEIHIIQEAYADAAVRAKMAGFDGVELHGPHGYLISQFLSPWVNRRNDIYGKDRALFVLEIVQKIREKCGHNFPLVARIGGSEFLPGGYTIEDQIQAAVRLDLAGVNAISVSGGIYETGYYIIPPMMMPHGLHAENAGKIKQAVNIPVFCAGRINDPRLAEELLEQGKIDLVGMSRPFVADPKILEKAQQGRFEDIRKCIACDNCISTRVFSAVRMTCSVNSA
ncbi:MAG: NADH:flavin oxidoreductase, partial [Firmicutes bacterium]|nr:NADH:flavin oxidoreductase [Bacillota bacterium]